MKPKRRQKENNGHQHAESNRHKDPTTIWAHDKWNAKQRK
jgi:hypothetical protein